MKVGTRITAATSALVTVTLGVYAFFDLRSSAGERRAQVESEAHDVAVIVQANFETLGLEGVLANAHRISHEISRAAAPWQIAIVPGRRATDASSAPSAAQLGRLRTIMNVSELHLAVQEGNTFIYVVPLRIPSASLETDFQPIGSLEVSRSIAHLDDAFRSELIRTL